MQVSMNAFPYALSLYNDSDRMLTLNRRVFVNENKPTNTSNVVLFRCSEFAKEFRDEVMIGANSSNNTWSLCCEEMRSDNEYTSVIFHSKKRDIFTDFGNDKNDIMIPKPLEDYDSVDFIEKLITYNISTFFIDSYDISRYGHSINLYGHLWSPPQDVLHYASDIEKLYNN